MTLTLHGEEWLPEPRLWVRFAALVCDHCGTRVDGEVGDVEAAIIHNGWTHDQIGYAGLTWCPTCRERVVA